MRGHPQASNADQPIGDTMNRTMRALASAVGFLIAAIPELALAQTDGAASSPDVSNPDMTWSTGTMSMTGTLAPAEILAEVRQQGFYPLGRPFQRGRVYVMYAADEDDMDVKLTVDAASGRVLWVAGVAAHFGGPGYYRYHSFWRSPPVPPMDVPKAVGAARNSFGAAGNRRNVPPKRFPPLPRERPASLAEAMPPDSAAKDGAAPVRSESPAAVQPAAAPVTMVPVAPLE